MSGVILFLLDLGESLGRLFVWLLDEPWYLVGALGVLFLILVVLAGSFQAGIAG